VTAQERRLLAQLIEIARGRLTKAGHVSIQSTTEGKGLCNTRWPRTCGPTCLSVNATIAEAEALLADSEPQQMRMAV
jgi:hypothetical protein